MCGLAGVLQSENWTTDRLADTTARMTAALAHRGPDDSAVFVDAASGVGLGFRRLSIIDLSPNGRQPMRSASGRYTVVFNGEIYNHSELRRELEVTGVRFRGHSDTEVMLAAFERWGVETAVQRFVGMFAIVLWDNEQHCLHLMRDRLGIKPLFVHWQRGRLLFGSELKALFACPGFDAEIDPAAAAAYLRYLYVPAPQSILSGASKLAAGHILTIRDPLNPPPPASAYWSIENVALAGRAEPFVGDDNDAVAELDSLLREAVSLRMRADVPVGAFLSGGIDSSLVVALMQQCTTAPVRTFTIGFEEQRWDETPYAERVARHIGTSHTTVSLTAQDSLALVQRLPAIFDEPLADPSQLPTFLISQVARKDVTVALCGDGGDELFAGYNRYSRGASLIARASGTPRWLRTRVGQAMASTSSQNWDRSISHLTSLFPSLGILQLSGDRAHKVAAVLGAGSAESMYRGLLSQWQKPRAVVNADERPDAVSHVFSMPDKLSLLDRMMLCDQMSYLPDDLLAKVDRASMAVGLEVRVPILDHRVAEFSWRLPDRMRLRQDASKWILRRVLDKYVPRHLVDRPKMGFSVPINEWLRGPLRRWADDLLYGIDERKDHLLNGAAVVAQWNGFKAGRNHYGMAIWAVLMLEAWRTHWLQQPQIGRPRVRTMAGRI